MGFEEDLKAAITGAQDDEVSDDYNETDQESAAEDTTEDTSTETDDSPKPFIKVKHANAERELTEEEAVEAVQMGLFLKDKGGVANLKRLETKAKIAGYDSINEYLDAIDEATLQSEAEQMEAEDFIPREAAIELIKSRAEKATNQQKQREIEELQAQEDRLLNEVREFNLEFPDVKVGNLPKEVVEAKRLEDLKAKEGKPYKSLTDLYFRYQVKQDKEAEKVKEQTKKNVQSSTDTLNSVADTEQSYREKLRKAMEED